MSDANIVNYAHVVEACISCSDPQEKNVPVKPPQPAGSGGKYHEIPLVYIYGDRRSDFLMEWPEMYAATGLSEKLGPSGRPDYSIMVGLPDKGNTQVLTQKLNEIHKACCKIVHQKKAAVRMFEFDPERPGSSFKNPIWKSRDKITGELLPGRDSTVFLKCFKRGYGATEEKTLFHRPVSIVKDGKVCTSYESIPWEIVKNVELRFIPLIHIKKIYVGGGKASLQMEMVSAIVTHIAGRGTTSKQTATLENLVKTDANLVSTLEEQIAKLTMQRQTLLMGSAPPTQNNPTGQGNPQGNGQPAQYPQGNQGYQQNSGYQQNQNQGNDPHVGNMGSISGPSGIPGGPQIPLSNQSNTNYVSTPSGPAVGASMQDFLSAGSGVSQHSTQTSATMVLPAPTLNLRSPAMTLK